MMKRFNSKKGKKGFTLIELIVVISLLGFVLLIAYNMQLFGNKVYNKGSSKADIQSNLRLSSNFISDKIRYASNVKILPSKPDSLDPTKEYIYSEGGVLKLCSQGNVSNISGGLPDVASTLYFEDADAQTVYFKINGVQKGENYQIDSSVYMLNVGTGGIATSSGSAIEFVEGIAVNSDVNAKPVEAVNIDTYPSGTIQINQTGTLQFVYTVVPTDASINTVSWAITSGNAYASITQTGLLNVAAAPVNTVIQVQATALDGSGTKSNIFSVTAKALGIVNVTSVVVSSDTDYIFKTIGSLQMVPQIEPSNATDKRITWTIDKANPIATISPDGLLKTNSTNTTLGDITVTATSVSNPSAKGTKIIHIIPDIKSIDDLHIDCTKTKIQGNDYNYTVKCYLKDGITPLSNSTGIKAIKYYVNSDNPTLATSNTFAGPINKQDTLHIIFTPISGDSINTSY
jgi:prepilin-type N-terminal cleavage/methylation domain-containing protein